MDVTSSELTRPRFRPMVAVAMAGTQVDISAGGFACSFEFDEAERDAVATLMAGLEAGGRTAQDLAAAVPEIADKVPSLLQDFDRLRLLTESDGGAGGGACVSGQQLYREVRRVADRVVRRTSTSAFHRALVDGTATREQLVGYALEYHWIVSAAPGLIAPALATARSREEQALVQGFLASELGHDRLLARALAAVDVTPAQLDVRQPLPTTFALCASLGVYARQHPLSFKACLFLFERPQERFLEAFEARSSELGLPEAFTSPLRQHSDVNVDHDHEDISRDLLAVEAVVDAEAAVVTKRHVALLAETMILHEHEILDHYGSHGTVDVPAL